MNTDPAGDIPLFRVFMSDEAVQAATEVLRCGYIGQGARVEQFEAELRTFFGTPFVATVNSCTSALHLALRLLDDLPGDEILTTPLTCSATNWPILANGLRLRWVDVDPHTCNIDLADVKRKLSPRTKAVMVVHWGGYPVDLDALRSLLDEYTQHGRTIPIIEDCAHALGAKLHGRLIGSHGNLACFSLQAIKLVTAVDGGILVSPTQTLHRRAKLLRWYGIDRDVPLQDMRCELDVPEWGYKFHLNDVCAAIGHANFRHWCRLWSQQKDNSDYYDQMLADVPGLTLLDRRAGFVSGCWLYTLRAERRDDLMRRLKERGIICSRVHERNDKHSCVKPFWEPLPQLDELISQVLCLPVGWWLTHQQRERIAAVIREGW